jgi:CubicO group peptidase (beta-lactamase class C family)
MPAHDTKRLMVIVTAMATLLLSLVPVPVHATESKSEPARRADVLFEQYTRDGSPGLAVAVIRQGEVVFARGYGLADVQRRIPISTSTVFNVGSVSKQFTGLAVAMLVNEGRLSLDDDLRTQIPQMQPTLPGISVRQLSQHTSGLRDFIGALRLADVDPRDPISFNQMLKLVTRQNSVNFPPGTQYSYSNTNYALLAEIVERVAGKRFPIWMSEHVFEPLGMTHSQYLLSPTSTAPSRAMSYLRNPEGEIQYAPDNLSVYGCSSLLSSVDDLVLWMRNFGDAHVGGRDALTLMHSPKAADSGVGMKYAYGLEHQVYRGQPTLEHSGGWAGFTSNVMYFPEHHSGVIVLSNFGAIHPINTARALADLFLPDILAPVDKSHSAKRRSVRVAPRILDRYVGAYQLGAGWYVRITREGRSLVAGVGSEPKARLVARSETAFRVQHYGAEIEFVVDVPGPASAILARGRRSPRVDETGFIPPKDLSEFVGQYSSHELDATYPIELRSGSLVLMTRSPRPIKLSHAWRDDFSGSAYPFTSIEFQRDEKGRVTGLLVNANDRNRDVKFVRRAEAS